MLGRLLEKQAHDRIVTVNMPAQAPVEEASRPGPQSPEGQQAVEKKKEKKLQRAGDIGRGHRNALAVHLDGALPLLQVEPRAEEEPDENRDHVTPEIPVVGRQFFHPDAP